MRLDEQPRDDAEVVHAQEVQGQTVIDPAKVVETYVILIADEVAETDAPISDEVVETNAHITDEVATTYNTLSPRA